MEMQLSLTDVDTASNETFVKTAKSRKCLYQNCDMQISLWSHAEYLRSVKISKRGKVRRSDTRPGDVRERAERCEGNNTTPSEIPLFRRVCPCVRFFFESRVCVPAFACESKRGAFVGEVEKRNEERLGDKIYGCSFAEFSPSADSGGSQRTGKCMYIKAWRNQGLQMLTT